MTERVGIAAAVGDRAAATLEAQVWGALASVDDPELGLSVTDLGLVYAVDARSDRIAVQLTLTSQHCPLGRLLQTEAIGAIRRAVGDGPEVDVDLVFQPPWSPARMTAAVRSRLGWPG